MGLFGRNGKSGIKCPACGGIKVTAVSGTQAVMSYPGFYTGVANSPDVKEKMLQCRDCKNIFRADN